MLRNAFENLATEAVQLDIKRAISDYEIRFDYGGVNASYPARSDGNPVFIGKALNGTATSAASWTVQLFDYDALNRPVRIRVQTISWDNRGTATW